MLSTLVLGIALAGGTPTLELSGTCPGTVSLQAGGLTPGGAVVVAWADLVGSTAVPSGACAGLEVGLAAAEPVLFATASPAGTLSFVDVAAGAPLCGKLLRVLDVESCGLTNIAQLPGPGVGALSLAVSGDCPGLLDVEVDGALPGATLLLAWSPEAGSSTISGGPCGGTPVDLATPTVLLELVADGAGQASAAVVAPEQACGYVFQLLDTASCAASNVVALGGMELVESHNGFGRLLPYEIFQVDSSGLPTSELIQIRSIDDLIDNVTPLNPVLPIPTWPEGALLPSGAPGNQFLAARFSQTLDVDSVLTPGAPFSSYLLGTITVVAIDPPTGTTTQVPGQAFVGGQAYGAGAGLETWVVADPDDLDGDGLLVEAAAVGGGFPGLGFPGTESSYNALDLVAPDAFVFVPDSDGDLTTHESFPTGLQIRMQMTEGVRSVGGVALSDQAVASSTVGADDLPPEVKIVGSEGVPVIIPGNGDFDVDPETDISIEFTEPLQILSVGSVPGSPPLISASILVQFGPAATLVTMPFSVLPRSPFDFTSMVLDPAYAFPGAGPSFPGCDPFNQVMVVVNPGQLQDLAALPNLNTLGAATFFSTGEGPGLVNAPVAPDTIYAARGGSQASLSVIDLNGFGAGTGDPTYNPLCPIEKGNTNYPNNPNVQLQGSFMVPPLSPGSCTFNGGSAGVFTLSKDSSLDDRLLRSPLVESIDDLMLGHALDNVFNNGSPFGCQSGGGNLCAATGLKVVAIASGGSATLAPAGVSGFPIKTEFGVENLVSWAPHPNPPPLVFPPLCVSPAIGGQEPTSVDTTVNNILVPGPTPLGLPDLCIPPQNMLSSEQNAFFVGPSLPSPSITSCSQYAVRQQVGQFLYVVDRVAGELVVLNSNRMTVLERIPLPDPTSLAMSPDLDFLAVTNQAEDLVSFLSIDPSSSSFHQVVHEVPVGDGPTGIAWESGNEDILVCNEGDGTVTLLSAFTLDVRKTLTDMLGQPFEVVTTPRQLGFGSLRGVYYAYILNRDGTVSLFESGPDGVNGWGYDDVIGRTEFAFTNPRAMRADVSNLSSGVWIAHENPVDFAGQPTGVQGGAITNLYLQAGALGILPLDPGFLGTPMMRDLEFQILGSLGEGELGLTGVPTDLAFDNQRNLTALTNFSTSFSAGSPLSINGKSLVKPLSTDYVPVHAPRFLFASVPNSSEGPGVVDVILLEGAYERFDSDPFEPGVQSIPVPGVTRLMDYFRP